MMIFQVSAKLYDFFQKNSRLGQNLMTFQISAKIDDFFKFWQKMMIFQKKLSKIDDFFTEFFLEFFPDYFLDFFSKNISGFFSGLYFLQFF